LDASTACATTRWEFFIFVIARLDRAIQDPRGKRLVHVPLDARIKSEHDDLYVAPLE
jgi:hypothetical protein